MIKKYLTCFFLLFVFSCTNIEFVLKNNIQTSPLKDKTLLLVDKNLEERFVKGLYSKFGNNAKYEYILKTTFIEKKENRIVKNNQVAEKIEYTLEVNYDLFYKLQNILRFSIVKVEFINTIFVFFESLNIVPLNLPNAIKLIKDI